LSLLVPRVYTTLDASSDSAGTTTPQPRFPSRLHDSGRLYS